MPKEIHRFSCVVCQDVEFTSYHSAYEHEKIPKNLLQLQKGALYRFKEGGEKPRNFVGLYNPITVGVVLKERGFGFDSGKNTHVNSYEVKHISAGENLGDNRELNTIKPEDTTTRKTLATDATELSEEEFEIMKNILSSHFSNGFGGISIEDLVRGKLP